MPIYCIIGTNRGLGLEFVRQLVKAPDVTIIATARPGADLTDLEAAAASLPAGRFLATECDVANVPTIHQFANKLARWLNGRTIDVLVCNAGINGTPASSTSLSLDHTRLMQQISVNVVGPAKVTEFLLDHRVLAPAVRIVNISSSLGSMEYSSKAPRLSVSYSISKAALNMLTVHQAGDIHSRLPSAVIIALDPGWVKTSMGGDAAPLTPKESISGMLGVIKGLGDADNGAFFGYDGKKRPW